MLMSDEAGAGETGSSFTTDLVDGCMFSLPAATTGERRGLPLYAA